MTTMRVSELLSGNVQRKNYRQPKQLVDFASEVIQALPGCKVVPTDDGWSWVYMPEDHFALGRIGYGVFTCNGGGERTYTVHTRTITNAKYNTHAKQYRMKSSTSLSAAVKNARRYLRRYDPVESAHTALADLRDGISSVRDSLRSKVAQVERELLGSAILSYGKQKPLLLDEIMYLFDAGHTFSTPGLMEKVAEYRELTAEHDSVKSVQNTTFVQIRQVRGRQRTDVVPVSNLFSWEADYDEPQTYYDSLPEDIAERVAVLSMVNDDTYVHGVGFKVEDGMYYVDR